MTEPTTTTDTSTDTSTDTQPATVARLRQELFTRRRVTGFAVAGAAVPLLAACGSDDSSSDAGSGSTTASSSGSSASASGGSSSSASAEALTTTSEIEVGGGAIFPDQEVVVTQPTAGTFKCFSAICTHQGCLVSSVDDGEINCTCHGSQFSITDGSVDQGPATEPLAEKKITVSGDTITLA